MAGKADIFPENRKTNCVVDLSCSPGSVIAKTKKDDKINDVLKKLSFYWDGLCWVNYLSGEVGCDDYCVYIARELILNGIPVCVKKNAKKRIVNWGGLKQNNNYVTANDSEYIVRLVRGHCEFYRIKNLCKGFWDKEKHAILISEEFGDILLDMAERYDLWVSRSAKNLYKKYENKIKKNTVKIKQKKENIKTGKKKIKNGVIDDLKD